MDQIFRDLILSSFKHGINQCWVPSKFDPIAFKVVKEFFGKTRLFFEHVRITIEKYFEVLDNIVGPLLFKEFFSYMWLSHISAINLFLSETSLNSVVLEHIVSCLILDLLIDILEGVVTCLHSGIADSERFSTILNKLSLLLAELLDVSDRVIYDLNISIIENYLCIS